ncbi:MAG TPA: class I SAM-dependent methyltransferase [Solirubrobacteraceae bacterium]|nr:class I SAM-dependent methyltransferase [Solirubrobacteraceae bacterium]
MSRLRHGAERAARRLGWDLVRRGPLSPVPEVPPDGDPVWSRRAALPGVRFDLDEQLVLLEGPLLPHLGEFASDVRGAGFELWNGLYQAGDAEVLYALLRHLRPARVVEIGSGHSTAGAAAACAANAREGAPCELVAIDPEPRVEVAASTPGLSRVVRTDCRAAPAELYERLEPGDVLFVDTWHVVKLGAEVNWIVLDLLPRLAPGVWVHFPDVFLPYEYPRYMFTTAGYLNEQHLLEAFLLGGGWTVELAMAALFRDRFERLASVIPSLREPVPGVPELRTWLPSAIWLRRR